MNNWLYHGLVGNDAPEGQVGFTRGGVLAGIMGPLNVVVLTLPIDGETKAIILASLNPTTGLLRYPLFAGLDKWLRSNARTPRRRTARPATGASARFPMTRKRSER